ncbi:hypothetical protein [Devosia sp. Leaf64]|uniref:hypothetical protein n=1 Tax=Devosia sp. Leaf64 TaxID=1736229 RepID=UPI000712CD0E|nr:hypothetical protein [Devosia sp. Leaf64]KQN75090.1 hypothetical protein ASE94_01865 [Devosia sp. Leaf64]
MLPEIDGTDWRADGEKFLSPVSRVLWKYRDSDPLDLVRAGITFTKGPGGFYAEYDPRKAPEKLTIFYMDKLRAKHSEFIERHVRQRENKRAVRERRDSALARAVATKERWGQFTSGYKTITDLTGQSYLLDSQKDALDRYVRVTEKRAEAMLGAAKTVKGGVDWPDDLVEEALIYMTDLDSDERSVRNKSGWDIVHGPRGHWAVAMLPVDRDLALRVARTIVGHYADRQLKHIADRVGSH